MELFEKIYSCYYRVVQRILDEAARNPLNQKQMKAIADQYGFAESALTIVPKLIGGDWAFLEAGEDGRFRSKLMHPPTTPLTTLQKRWLKALLTDRRFRLFLTEDELKKLSEALTDIEPIFSEADFHYYDRYLDGDSYEDESYREHFQTILKALEEEQSLIIAYVNRRGRRSTCEAVPCQLQYSSKNDKFRIRGFFCRGDGLGQAFTMNVERITACHLSKRSVPRNPARTESPQRCAQGKVMGFGAGSSSAEAAAAYADEPVILSISGERNSLERTMLHFASYEKRTEYSQELKAYVCSINYDPADETELLIDILSFGPSIRVLGPEHFLSLVRERVQKQHQIFYNSSDGEKIGAKTSL